MPISALQHRASVAMHQGKSPERGRAINRGVSTMRHSPLRDGSAFPGADMTHVVSSRDVFQTRPPQRGAAQSNWAVPLIMLLSQVRVSGAAFLPTSSTLPVQQATDYFGLSKADAPLRGVDGLFDPARLPRHVGMPRGQADTATASPRVREDVSIKKMDFSCVESRAHLSLSDMLRQIGRTLVNPVAELAKESQVIYFYNKFGQCPSEEDVAALSKVTRVVDTIIMKVVALLPGSQPLQISQGIAGPLFKMIADGIDRNGLNSQDYENLLGNTLGIAKSIERFAPRATDGKKRVGQISVPEGIQIRNGRFQIRLRNTDRDLVFKNDDFYVEVGGHLRKVSYSPARKKWFRVRENGLIGVKHPATGEHIELARIHRKNGWTIYKEVDPLTKEAVGPAYVITKSGKPVNFRKVQRRIEKARSRKADDACVVGAIRARRSPCPIDPNANSRGLLEQRGFRGPLYRADIRSPDELAAAGGFGDSEDFGALGRMTDHEHALIAAESLVGALRYIRRSGATYYIYEIDSAQIRGVSLNENIDRNEGGAMKFLDIAPEKGNDIDWAFESSGANYLHEVHVNSADVTLDKVRCIGKSTDVDMQHRIQNLKPGAWEDYL